MKSRKKKRFLTETRRTNWFQVLQEDIFISNDNTVFDHDSALTVYRYYNVSPFKPREERFFSLLIYIHDFLAAETKGMINRERLYVKSNTHQRLLRD